MEQQQKYKPINPLKLLDASEVQLRQWESEGRIKIHPVSEAGSGCDYIEIVKPN